MLKAANDAVDPTIDMRSWNFMSHFEACSPDVYQVIMSEESPIIKEYLYRKNTFYGNVYSKEVFLKEFEYMLEVKRLCIPLYLSFRVINPKEREKIYLKICRTVNNKMFSK